MNQTQDFSQFSKNRAIIQAIAAIIVALIAIAFVPILLKFSEREISPTATIFHRFWIATVILGGWNGLSKFGDRASETAKEPISGKILKLLGLMGILATGSQLFWAMSLTKTSVANSALMHNLSPLLTILGARLFFQQQFNSQFIIGAIAAIGGIIFLGWEDFSLATGKFQGDAIAFLSAFFWAGYLLAIEKLRLNLTVKSIILWRFACNTLFLLDPVFASGLAWVIFSESLSFVDLFALFVIVTGISLALISKGGIKT